MDMPVVTSGGARIPAVGLGTMTLKDATCVELVGAALRLGYRHLDTAQMYGNEREVGEGLAASGVKREDVFLTTKIWHDRLAPGDLERSVDESLARLKVAAVDLLLIHWPNARIPLGDTLRSLAAVKRDGRTRHIGLANFTIPLIEQAVSRSPEPLVNNQIEVHPYLDQSRVIAACRRHGLVVTAYCPLARGKVPADPALIRIGDAHGKTATQTALRYLVQLGLAVIPRTSKPERLKENLEVFDFTLSDAEMAEIAALRRADGRVVNPPHAPPWDG
jgi:diketogulonate reductase-like aldo/keto reductase